MHAHHQRRDSYSLVDLLILLRGGKVSFLAQGNMYPMRVNQRV